MTGDGLPLAVTMGDPAGVGPSISWKAYDAFRNRKRPFYVIADPRVLEAARPKRMDPHELVVIASPDEAAAAFRKGLPVSPITSAVPKAGEPDPAAATAILDSIRLAVMHVQAGRAA
ncbi:MAG TPA: 4-hydroxythreonine-4-phosphate dehydrogenase PdxA, partial [Hyphomonadaceae bacterium]